MLSKEIRQVKVMMEYEIEQINKRIIKLEHRFAKKQNTRNPSFTGSNFSRLGFEDDRKPVKAKRMDISNNENASMFGESPPNVPHSFIDKSSSRIKEKYILKKPYPRYQLLVKDRI